MTLSNYYVKAKSHFKVVVFTVIYILSSAQGTEGVPLAHGPESALHVQPPPAEDSGSDADDG